MGQLSSAPRTLASDLAQLDPVFMNTASPQDASGNFTSGVDALNNTMSVTRSFNRLNQVTSQNVPSYVLMRGEVESGATVTVSPVAGIQRYTRDNTDYYRASAYIPSATTNRYLYFTNVASLPPKMTLPAVSATNISGFFVPTNYSIRYDNAGNTLSDGYWDYTWDGYNRLTKVESKAGAPNTSKRMVTFKYDATGRRIARITSAADATGNYRETDNKKFVYNGWNLVAELNGTNNGIIRSYLWANNILLSIRQNGKTYLPTFDGRGNVMSLVQSDNKAVVARYDYSSFGLLLRASGPMALENPIRFSSEYQDDVTGFIYYGYRYFNPNTATWLSRDPIGMAGGMNLYAMVNNDPINQRDYLGLIGFTDVLQEGGRKLALRPLTFFHGLTLATDFTVNGFLDPRAYIPWPVEYFNSSLTQPINEIDQVIPELNTDAAAQSLADYLVKTKQEAYEFEISGAVLGTFFNFILPIKCQIKAAPKALPTVVEVKQPSLPAAKAIAKELTGLPEAAPKAHAEGILIKIECEPVAAKTGANLTKLAEQDVVVGMMKEGQVLKQVPYPSNPMLAPTHEAIAKELGVWAGKGELAPGVEAFTVWKEGGKVMVRGSGNFTPTVSAETEAALRKLFE